MTLQRVLGVWLLLLPLMVMNGIFRELVLVGLLGRGVAEIASALLGIVIILAVTRPFIRRSVFTGTADLLRISSIWTVLTVAFELLFGHYVDGASWQELLANYAIWRGNLWPLVLASLALSPFIWGRWLRQPGAPGG